MQHEGQGDELAIAMTNKDEEDAKIVWILSDSYNKNKWVQGRVEIRPPDDPNLEYRVCAKVFFEFSERGSSEARPEFAKRVYKICVL